MGQKDYKKLIMVEVNDKPKQGKAAQSNKFYEMIWDGGATFTVNYGRVESSSTTITYPYNEWNKKYNEKVKKGYKDVTEFVAVEVVANRKTGDSGYAKISDGTVHEFVELMRKYRDNLVSTTYSVKAEAVSENQVKAAQLIIDTLNKETLKKKIDTATVNTLLMQLYTVIPRKMKNVKDHLIPAVKLEDILEQEQDNLDAMASQVNAAKPKDNKVVAKSQTILDEMGVTMVPVKGDDEIQYLVDQVNKLDNYNRAKIKQVYRVDKPGENDTFDKWLAKQKNKQTRILIHGTKNSSVLPIMDIGLKIRPKGNFQFSGKAYGDGNYFSETMVKSLGYTGWENDKVILVYEVHVGKPFKYSGWYTGNSFTLNYKNLQEKGYDSTFVSAGNGLLNSEIIAYREEQCRIKYIIWLK